MGCQRSARIRRTRRSTDVHEGWADDRFAIAVALVFDGPRDHTPWRRSFGEAASSEDRLVLACLVQNRRLVLLGRGQRVGKGSSEWRECSFLWLLGFDSCSNGLALAKVLLQVLQNRR